MDKQNELDRKEKKQVNFRVSDIEYQRLDQNASALSMTVSGYAKFRVQSSDDVSIKFSHDDAVLFLRELGRIGTNINQIARFCNQQADGLPEELAERLILNLKAMREGIDALWQQLN